MFKFIGIVTLVVFLFNGCSSKAPAPTWKHIGVNDNQLKNPSFELNSFSKAPHFWIANRTKSQSGGLGAHTGDNYIVFPWAKGQTTVKQLVSLQRNGFDLSAIDKGLYSVKFGGYQMSSDSPADTGNILLSFFDKNKKFITEKGIGLQNAGKHWKYLEKTVPVPKHTRYVQYNFIIKKAQTKGRGQLLDDAFLYVFKGKQEIKQEIKQAVIVPKLETKLTNIVTNKDISIVAYSQANKVIAKDLATGKVIFKKEYQCKNKAKFVYVSSYIEDDILMTNNVCDKNRKWSYEKEFVALNKKLKNKNLQDLFNKIAPGFFMKRENQKIKIYDLKSKKLLYSFPSHLHLPMKKYIDKKSNKIVFYELTYNNFSDYKGNDFLVKNVYIFDMKSKKGKKVSLAKKGKKYKSIFPVGYFVGTKKNGDKVFYQISAQNKKLDRMAIAAKNGFKDKEWDNYGNLYPSVLNDYDNKATQIFYKGINLSTMKFEKLNRNYIFSNLELNRVIDLKDVFNYLDELGGPTRTKNIEYKKLSYANSQRVNDKLAIQYVGDFNNGLSLVDLKTGNIAYASKRNIYHLSLGMNNNGSLSNLYREGKDRGPYNIVSLDINTKQKNFKIKKKLYSFQANRDLTYRFFESADDKLLLVYKSERIGRTRDFSKTLSVINIATGKVSPIALPNNLRNTGFSIMKFTNEKIFITTDKTYEVINLNNKGKK